MPNVIREEGSFGKHLLQMILPEVEKFEFSNFKLQKAAMKQLGEEFEIVASDPSSPNAVDIR